MPLAHKHGFASHHTTCFGFASPKQGGISTSPVWALSSESGINPPPLVWLRSAERHTRCAAPKGWTPRREVPWSLTWSKWPQLRVSEDSKMWLLLDLNIWIFVVVFVGWCKGKSMMFSTVVFYVCFLDVMEMMWSNLITLRIHVG